MQDFKEHILEITCVTSLNTISYCTVISVIDVCLGLAGTVSFRIRYRFQGHWDAHVGSME
jgi:hypothetical protein